MEDRFEWYSFIYIRVYQGIFTVPANLFEKGDIRVIEVRVMETILYLTYSLSQYREEGTLCRNADGNCDLEEYCSGDSPVVSFLSGDSLL